MQLLDGVIDGGAILVAHLRQARDTRLDAVTDVVVRYLFLQLLDKIGALGARPDKTHLAAKHIEHLRQLVDAQLANDITHARDARIVGLRPDGLAVALRIAAHAAKFQHIEGQAVASHPLLLVKHGAAVFQADAHGRHQHHGQRRQADDRTGRQIEHPLRASAEKTLVEAAAIDQIARLQGIDADLARFALEKRGRVDHLDAAQRTFQQLLGRKRAIAPVADGHDDLMRGMALGHGQQ